jgi:outer membrane protein assembly factor BamB
MMKRAIIGLVGILGLAWSCGAATPAEFRNDGSGRFPDAQPTVKWSTTDNVLWKTALPNWSNASPILVRDRIFVCVEPATIICLAAKTGAILWQDTLTDLPATTPPAHAANGYTSATPCSDGRQVWAVFGHGVVASWDVSGKKRWAVTLESPPHKWGGCISPRLAGGLLIVQYDKLFGLDPKSGAEKWRLQTGWGWGTPVVARIGNRDILYTCKGAAVDAATGRALPAQGLPSLAYNSPCLVDGVLYYVQQKPNAFVLPATPEALPQPLWKDIVIPKGRYYGTPLIHDGLVYAINAKGKLSVLDQATGATLYSRKFAFKTVYPSPTLAGEYVFLSGEGGKSVVIKAGRQYEEVAQNNLEPFRSCPIFAGTRMYIRGHAYLWCIGR